MACAVPLAVTKLSLNTPQVSGMLPIATNILPHLSTQMCVLTTLPADILQIITAGLPIFILYCTALYDDDVRNTFQASNIYDLSVFAFIFASFLLFC